MDKKKEPHGRAGGIASGKARDKHALCGAKKRSDGKPCRKFAGEGTDHFGIGRCRLHGGSTRTHKRHAVKVEAERRAPKFGKPKKVMPGDALMEMLWTAYGQVHWLADEISKQKDMNSFEARVLIQSHKDERDRVAHVAKTALDAGVQERQIRLAELYGEVIATAIGRILDGLKLSPAQRTRSREVVRTVLLALEKPEEPPVLGPPTVEGKAKRKRAAGRP
jgi:hypothetical protein